MRQLPDVFVGEKQAVRGLQRLVRPRMMQLPGGGKESDQERQRAQKMSAASALPMMLQA